MASTTTTTNSTGNNGGNAAGNDDGGKATPIITIYAIPGSQFSAKVITALDARKVPHYVELVSFDTNTRMKELPSGGLLTPEMKVEYKNDNKNQSKEPEVVPDSEDILHWMDNNMETKYFPAKEASELSVRASDGTLAASVWYYNWVDEDGYRRSMEKSLEQVLPSFICFFRSFIIGMILSSVRTKYRGKVAETLFKTESDNDNDVEALLNDEPKIRSMLLDELKYFRSQFKKPSGEQPYLVPNTKEPTAADFSVYAQLERLVGGGDEASDVPIPPAIPEIKETTNNKKEGDGDDDLSRLWEWHDAMRKNFPAKFKGKRKPKE